MEDTSSQQIPTLGGMEIFGHLGLTREEVRKTWAENQEPSWDGYGAKPISKQAAEAALEFVCLLRSEIRKPDVVPEADGAMGFEWRDKHTILVLSFLPNGCFTFAGHFPNNEKVHGSGKFEGEIPVVVETLLDRYFREDRSVFIAAARTGGSDGAVHF